MSNIVTILLFSECSAVTTIKSGLDTTFLESRDLERMMIGRRSSQLLPCIILIISRKLWIGLTFCEDEEYMGEFLTTQDSRDLVHDGNDNEFIIGSLPS